ncbi:MAG: hypothetical protein V3U42_09095 [candidate division NC10 bacterium]
MQKRRVLGLVGVVLLWLGGIGLAEDPYTWAQVVERGMPNFNDQAVAQEAVLATHPLTLSFPSGVHIVFVFVNHAGETYGIYHDRETRDVVGIARVDLDPAWPQGLHFYEFFVDTGLLKGRPFTGQFLYLAGNNRIFAGLCRIAHLSKEARAHGDCPGSA